MCPMVRLRPTARPVRRGPGEVQFGLAPGHGIVLAGLSEAESDLLLSLAGDAGTSRDEALARRFGVPVARVDQFVTALRAHHLLVDPSDPHTPSGTRPTQPLLAVPGHGRVVDRIRQELTDAGSRVAQDAPAAGETDLVVLCALDVIAPDAGRVWQEAGTPQLPVVLRAGAVVIGPLIHPGQSACLRCLDLHRRDRDGAWPRILSQLACATDEFMHRVEAPEAHAAAIAALVTMVTMEALVSPKPALGVSWQVALPWPDLRTRQWEQHPHCPCSTELSPTTYSEKGPTHDEARSTHSETGSTHNA